MIGELRAALAFVRQTRDHQREGLGVASDPERSDVDGIESHVADPLGGDLLRDRKVSPLTASVAP